MATPRTSLASHNLHREDGSCHAATIELSPWQKLDVTYYICALHRLHPLSLSTNTSCVQQMSASYYLSTMLIITFLSNKQQVEGCVTRPFISAKGVACETTPGSPPEFLDFFLLPVQIQDVSNYGKHQSLFGFCVK